MTDWDHILTVYGPQVWRTAYRLLGNAHDADDCLQEVFLSSLEYSRRRSIQNWAAFLQTSVTNRSLEKLRVRSRQHGRLCNAIACESVSSSEPGPQQQAMSAELIERLRAALARLPARYAEVFCLCCLLGMEHREVAEILGIKVGTLYARLHRARQRLSKLLAPVGTGSDCNGALP